MKYSSNDITSLLHVSLLPLSNSTGNGITKRESRAERQEKSSYGWLQVIYVFLSFCDTRNKVVYQNGPVKCSGNLSDFLFFSLHIFVCFISNPDVWNLCN